MSLPNLTRLHPFRPRLVDALRGYDRSRFFADLGAGATVGVGVVALPLAMAFAGASGGRPEPGLFTAIVAGLIISALGGSQVQIGRSGLEATLGAAPIVANLDDVQTPARESTDA